MYGEPADGHGVRAARERATILLASARGGGNGECTPEATTLKMHFASNKDECDSCPGESGQVAFDLRPLESSRAFCGAKWRK